MMKRSASTDGFTLIEVMIALAILGIGLFVLLEGHYASFRLYEEAHNRASMRNLFEKALGFAETEVMRGNLSGGEEFGRRWPDYAFTYQAEQMGESEIIRLFEVTVTIETPNREEEPQSMTMYVYDMR